MGIDPNTKPGAGRDAPRDAPRLGVLMLDTRFPRWPGDVGCDEGFAAAPLRERVAGAVPSEVVTDAEALQRSAFPPAFLQAALRLQAGGAAAVTTSCGFLVLLQAALQGALGVPLVTSALLQLPRLLQAAPRVGEHPRLGDVVVEGVDADGPFARPLLANLAQRDFDAAEADLMAAARRLQQRAPDLHQVVLECTNMPPHATALRRATGWQLHGLLDDPALRGFLAPPPAGSRGASASPGPAA
jgi:hypothetical protein